MKKRILAILLSAIMAVSSLATATTTVQAAEPTRRGQVVVHKLPMPQESDYVNEPSTYSLKSKVIKEAIQFILKHGDEAAKVVEKVAGKAVAKNFTKHFTKISKALKPLLKWVDIPAQAVYDAVYRGLYNSGVSSKVAANIALAIKEGLSWFI